MSLLRKNRAAPKVAYDQCTDCKAGPTASTFRLIVEPKNTDVRARALHDDLRQLENADRVQSLFVPSLARVDALVHGDGYHVHPDQPDSVGHIAQMHTMMEPHGLTARLSFTPDRDRTAVTAALTAEHVQDLVQNGSVDVCVPMDQGTFRLHSTRPGRITAVEYAPTEM